MIAELAKANKEKVNKGKKDLDVYSGAYYTLGGVLAGFIFHDLYHKFKLPGYDNKIDKGLISGIPINNPANANFDKMLVTFLATGLMFAELFGVKGAGASGGGMLIGFGYAQNSSSGKYIGSI